MKNGKTTVNVYYDFTEPIYGCTKLVLINDPPVYYYNISIQNTIIKIINYINKFKINKLNILMNFGNLHNNNDNKFISCIINSKIKSLKIHYTISSEINILLLINNMKYLQKITLYQIEYYGFIFHQQIIKVLTNNYKLMQFKIINHSYMTEYQNENINKYMKDINIILTRNKNNHNNVIQAVIQTILCLKQKNKLIFTKEIIQKILKYLYLTKYESCWTF